MIKRQQTVSDAIRNLFRFPPLEKIICLLSQNKRLNSFIGRMVPENHFYPPGSLRRVRRNGINYLLDISDYQHWLIYFGIAEDRPEELYNLIVPGATVIDVGANIGQTSMNMARKAGKEGLILGFEPDPINFSRAQENLKLNAFSSIHYFNYGLGAQQEKLHLKVNTPLNRGGNRIDRNIPSADSFIQIEKLDDIARQQALKKIDLIKIDVEGFEMEVLKGSLNVLKQFKPTLFIELDDRNLREQQTQPGELIHFLEKLNYTIINAQNKQKIESSQNFSDSHIDIICYTHL